jgi:hypothetical protein
VTVAVRKVTRRERERGESVVVGVDEVVQDEAMTLAMKSRWTKT